jgi:hypothetical protein
VLLEAGEGCSPLPLKWVKVELGSLQLVKAEPSSTSGSMHHNHLKLGSSLPLGMMHVCNLKDMSEFFELLISK